MPYQPVKLNLTQAQQKKAIRGAPIRLTKDAILNGAQIVMLHPLNAKKITKSANGINITFSPGEIMATASYNNMVPKMDMSNVEGSGFFDTIWSGIKGVGKFLKDSGIGTALADVAQPLVAGVAGENVAKGLREGLRAATGVGIKPKRGRKPKMSGEGLYLGGPRGSGLYL
tara:strand:- start:286 stop:798 length:513 start_codon:yes stop_codon:yes gene_type:complete